MDNLSAMLLRKKSGLPIDPSALNTELMLQEYSNALKHGTIQNPGAFAPTGGRLGITRGEEIMNDMVLGLSGGISKLPLKKLTYDPKLQTAAKRAYKTTKNPDEAGYVTPDGSMLDFSGRHYANKSHWPYLHGQRNVDHRELTPSIWNKLEKNPSTGSEAMSQFMNQGKMVRFKPGNGVVIQSMPTDAQIKTIIKTFRKSGEPLYVDVSSHKTGGLEETLEFIRPTFDEVKKALEPFVENKVILPTTVPAALLSKELIGGEQ